jgi:hypothetical protein
MSRPAVLVGCITTIGDTMLCTPALLALGRGYDANVLWCTSIASAVVPARSFPVSTLPLSQQPAVKVLPDRIFVRQALSPPVGHARR